MDTNKYTTIENNNIYLTLHFNYPEYNDGFYNLILEQDGTESEIYLNLNQEKEARKIFHNLKNLLYKNYDFLFISNYMESLARTKQLYFTIGHLY